MNSPTLIKLAEIANVADQNGEYMVANDAAKLIKEAQLWDAMRTLFDPSHTPGVDRNTPFWKRLSKGWSRGKMDRNLGLVLAIMAERTKLNNKINELIAPLQMFKEEVGSFYDGLKSGAIKTDNFREQARQLQTSLKQTLALVSGKELRQTLKMRERLEQQQVHAAERIKGLDEETRTNLVSLLKGEEISGASPITPSSTPAASSVPGAPPPASQSGNIPGLRNWMRSHKIEQLPYSAGATTTPGKHQFRDFVTTYGYNPKSITDYFENSGERQGQGFNRFPSEFSEMLRRARQIQDYDASVAAGTHVKKQDRGKTTPGATPEAAEQAATKALEDLGLATPAPKTEAPKLAPLSSPPPRTPIAPSPHGLTPEEEQIRLTQVKPTLDRIRQQQAERDKRHIEMAKELERPKPTVLPAPTKASRLERDITRLGRMQSLRKLSDLMQDDEDLLDLIDPAAPKLTEDEKETDRFDEKKDYLLHPDVEQDALEQQYSQEPYGAAEELGQSHWYTKPRTPEPIRIQSREEQLENVVDMIRMIDNRIDNMLNGVSNPDNRLSDELQLRELKNKKHKLEQMKNELSPLPEGWAND